MKSYRFNPKEKHPIIGIAQTCVQIYAGLHGMSFNKAMHVVAEAAGVSYSCLNNWFYGSVNRPFFDTIERVVHATGREISVGEHGMGSKRRFRVISGGRAA